MKEIPLKSGAVVEFQLADFDDSMALLEAVLREVIGVNIDIDVSDIKKLQELFGGDIMQLKDIIFKVVASKVVKDALWKCMSTCTYKPVGENAAARIDRNTFQTAKNRADYFPVAGEVLVGNLAPFFGNLQFSFPILTGLAAAQPPASSTG